MEKPQPGTDSTKALGATAPDPKQDIYWYVNPSQPGKTGTMMLNLKVMAGMASRSLAARPSTPASARPARTMNT